VEAVGGGAHAFVLALPRIQRREQLAQQQTRGAGQGRLCPQQQLEAVIRRDSSLSYMQWWPSRCQDGMAMLTAYKHVVGRQVHERTVAVGLLGSIATATTIVLPSFSSIIRATIQDICFLFYYYIHPIMTHRNHPS
jgi:hypothetical protein